MFSVVDVVGVWYAGYYFNKGGAGTHIARRLGVALGWAGAHHLAQYFPTFWMYARAYQFDWNNMLSAVEANISLVGVTSILNPLTSDALDCVRSLCIGREAH